MSAVIVGIGQERAGDDAVGLLVAREVARRGLPAREALDASALLPLLEDGRRVVIVDAVVGDGAPGEVRRIDVDGLGRGATPLSSHGLGVAEALALARALYGTPDVAVVGVFVAPRSEATGERRSVSGDRSPRPTVSGAPPGVAPPPRGAIAGSIGSATLSPAIAAAVGPAADTAIALSREQAELPGGRRGRRGSG